MLRSKVVVVGSNHHNALGVIRSLGEFGCNVFFVTHSCDDKSFVARSRYVEKHWRARSVEEVVDILLTNFGSEASRPIVIPADDHSVDIIDRNLNLLSHRFLCPNIKNQSCAIAEKMDKTKMNEIAAKYGFSVPRSFVLNVETFEKVNSVVRGADITYPCIVKPLRSIEGTKSTITVCESEETLLRILGELAPKYKRLLIQEYVEKETEFGVLGFANHEQEQAVILGVVVKLRESRVAPSATYGKLVKTHPYVDVDSIIQFVRDLEYTGIFDMDLIYSKGKVYFIEMNFRNGAYGYAFTRAGVNVPALWCLSVLGHDLQTVPTEVNREVRFMNEIADFRNVLDGQTGLVSWLRQFMTADAHLIYNRHDIKPFIFRTLGLLSLTDS